MTSEMIMKTIAQKIEAAFVNTSLPATISNGDGIDGTEVEESFRGKHWKDVTPELITSVAWDRLPFFSEESYRFYLPAYLLNILFHFEELDDHDLPDRVVCSLTPPEGNTIRFLRRVNGFTPEQKTAIYAFLVHYRELFPEGGWAFVPGSLDIDAPFCIDKAIEFWNKFA